MSCSIISLQVWETDVKVLNICGYDDDNVDPRLQFLQYQAFPDHKKNNIELVAYEGAGHLIEPPHSPLCQTSYLKLFSKYSVYGCAYLLAVG